MSALPSLGPTMTVSRSGRHLVPLTGPCRLSEAGLFGAQKSELMPLGCHYPRPPRTGSSAAFGDGS